MFGQTLVEACMRFDLNVFWEVIGGDLVVVYGLGEIIP